jgi:hypothetical protein
VSVGKLSEILRQRDEQSWQYGEIVLSAKKAAALRLADRIPKKSKKRARLTIVSSPLQDSDDPAAETSSQAPAISSTLLSDSTSAICIYKKKSVKRKVSVNDTITHNQHVPSQADNMDESPQHNLPPHPESSTGRGTQAQAQIMGFEEMISRVMVNFECL